MSLPALYFSIANRLRIRISDRSLFEDAKRKFTNLYEECNKYLGTVQFHTPVKLQKKIDEEKLIFTLSCSIVTERNVLLAYGAWGAEWSKYKFRDKKDYNLTMCLRLIAYSQAIIEGMIDVDIACDVLYSRDVEAHVGNGKRRLRRPNFEFEPGDPRFASYFCYCVKKGGDQQCYVRFVKQVGVDPRGETVDRGLEAGLANDLCSDLAEYGEFVQFKQSFDAERFWAKSKYYCVSCDAVTQPFDIVSTSANPFPTTKAAQQKKDAGRQAKNNFKPVEAWFGTCDWFAAKNRTQRLRIIVDRAAYKISYSFGPKPLTEEDFLVRVCDASREIAGATKRDVERMKSLSTYVDKDEAAARSVFFAFLEHSFADFDLVLDSSSANDVADAFSSPTGEANGSGTKVFHLRAGQTEAFNAYDDSITTLMVEDGVETIPAGAFFRCGNLREVLGGRDLKRIEPYAFYRCEKLVKFEATGLRFILGHAFEGCRKLSLPLQSNIESYGVSALDECDSTDEIVYADSPLFKAILPAFPHLKTLRFPDAFPCEQSSYLLTTAPSLRINHKIPCDAIVLPRLLAPKNEESFLTYSVDGPCVGYVIPDGVEAIRFENPVASVFIPRSIYEIYFSAPCERIELDSANPFLNYEAGVLKSKDGGDWFLTPEHFSNTFHKKLPSNIRTLPFWTLAQFNAVDLPESFSNDCLLDYDGWAGRQPNPAVWNKRTNYGNVAYIGKAGNPFYMAVDIIKARLKTLEFHPDTRAIAFAGYHPSQIGANIETILIPDGVTFLVDGCFSDFRSLSTVRLPPQLKSIPQNCFQHCGQLRSIDLPEGLEYIAEYAFASSGLTAIDIPASVQIVQRDAFQYCFSLQSCTLSPSTFIDEKGFNSRVKRIIR